MSLTSTKAAVSPQDFLPIGEMQGLIRRRGQMHLEEWQNWSVLARKDPRLIAYYPFNHMEEDKWDRMVCSLAEPLINSRDGGAVGARWTQGRWPGKEALEFKRSGERVRMNLDGTYAALTLTCWVKVDSVDKKYNSLLLTDGYDSGEPHWQIYEDGSPSSASTRTTPSTFLKNARPTRKLHHSGLERWCGAEAPRSQVSIGHVA